MGSLTLPNAGSVYVDTVTIIYSMETQAAYWSLLEPLWRTAQTGDFEIVSSELALMETLVKPLRTNDLLLTTAYEQLFQSAEVRPLPITQAVLREAAQLRASLPALRTPDTIHAATALMNGCALFLTNDTGFRRVPGLPLAVLDEVLAA